MYSLVFDSKNKSIKNFNEKNTMQKAKGKIKKDIIKLKFDTNTITAKYFPEKTS